jgi:acetylornithine deacetylase
VATAGSGVTVDFAWELRPIELRPLPGFDTTVVRFGTDLPYLAAEGGWGEGFLLGPGSIRVAHTENECVAKAELQQAVALYQRLATMLIEGVRT